MLPKLNFSSVFGDTPHENLAGDSAPESNSFAYEPPPYSEQIEDLDIRVDRSRSPVEMDICPPVIAVMGPTGSGKTTLISKLSGKEMKIGHNLRSCTTEVERVPCKVGNRYVELVDTPGFNDTDDINRSDTVILTQIADWLKDSYSDGMRLSGIIYLHSLTDARMTGSCIQNLRMFRKLCGDENLQNVMIATTKWGITPKQHALDRERELKSPTGFWGVMIAHNSPIRRFEDSEASARALVEEILRTGQTTFIPKIQEEVAQKGKDLLDTEAGAYLNEKLKKLSEQHEQEKKILRDELKYARGEHNLALQQAVRQQQEELDYAIAKLEQEQQILHLNTVEALQRRIQILEETAKQQGNSIPACKRGLWSSSWKCIPCRFKTKREGRFTCPECTFVQWNHK